MSRRKHNDYDRAMLLLRAYAAGGLSSVLPQVAQRHLVHLDRVEAEGGRVALERELERAYGGVLALARSAGYEKMIKRTRSRVRRRKL